jgi:hypothetical protein
VQATARLERSLADAWPEFHGGDAQVVSLFGEVRGRWEPTCIRC